MASINRVVLVGNLTRDPELRYLPSGTPVSNIGIAVNSRRKDSDGQWIDEANFFDIAVFGKQAENCSQFLAKGSQVAVDGRLRSRSWETNEGQKRSKVEVVAESVQFLGKPSGRGEAAVAPAAAAAGEESQENADEDIPF
jgi:single-strand DNA-binding protein